MGESLKWRARHAIAAAVGITLIEVLASSAVETRLAEDRPFIAVSDSAGCTFGPVHALAPGRYRWRVEVARAPARSASASSSLSPPDITRPPVWMGIRDAYRTEFDGFSWGVWACQVARTPIRHFDFGMRLRTSGRRRFVWCEPERNAGLVVPRALTLARETPLREAFGSKASERRDAPRALLQLLAWLATLVVAAYAGGWLRTRLGERGAGGESGSSAFSRGMQVLGWVGAFVAAGSALALGPSSALLTLAAGTGPAGTVRVMPFPGLDAPWGQLPYLATAAGLAAAALFGALVARRPTRIWALPTAAFGLAVAAPQLSPTGDFQIYMLAGQSLLAGVNPYPLKTVLNPPPFLLFTMLLALLPVQLAAFLWFGLKAAAVALCVRLARFAISDAYDCSTGPRWARPEWIALLAAGRLLGTDLMYGNTNVLVLLSLLVTAASWRARQFGAAGAGVVAGVAIKVTPGVFAVSAALAGRWRWALSTLLVAGVVTGASALAIEARAPGAGMGFLLHVLPNPGDLSLGRVDNQSLRGWLDRAVGGAPMNSGPGRDLPTLAWGARGARRVEYAFVALIGLALAALGRRARRAGLEERDARWADVWAAATLALLLVSPGSWTVHFGLLYLPLVVLAARARNGDRWAGGVVLLLGLIATLPAFSHFFADWIVATSALTIGSQVGLAALLARPVGRPA